MPGTKRPHWQQQWRTGIRRFKQRPPARSSSNERQVYSEVAARTLRQVMMTDGLLRCCMGIL